MFSFCKVFVIEFDLLILIFPSVIMLLYLGGAATSTYDFFSSCVRSCVRSFVRSFVCSFVLPLFARPVYLNQIKSQGCTRIIKTLVGHIFVSTR